MRKLFISLALVLGLVSCQNDLNLGVNVGGEQEVMINVALAEGTRAGSADGALDNGVLDNYQLRYILEIYLGENCSRQVIYSNETTASFPVRLAPGRAYDFVVWADFVEKGTYAEGADADLFYETSAGLDEISIIDGKPMTEARDAFYGVYNLAADKTVASISTIELKRPFAKIRVVTTDIEDLNKISVAVPTSAKITYKSDVTVYNKFNARKGEVSSDNATKEYTLSYANTYEIKDGKMTLFADYLFVPENGSTVKFDLDVTDHVSKSFNTEIPVNRNKLTTIEGDILTNGSDLRVEIKDVFDAETIYLEGNVKLTEDLNVNRPIVVPAGTTAVLDLNGKNIINNNPSENFGEGEGIVVYGNLTIEGEGTIQGTSMAVWARGGNGDAVINIKGGTFVGCKEGLAKGGRSVIYASSGNVVNIYGGEFKALAADETSFAATQYPVLNVADNNGMINIYGGRFHKQNPAAPGTEPAAWNATHPNGFLAPGYTATQNGDWYEVGVNTIKNADDFVTALDNAKAGDTILLGADAVLEGVFNFNKDQITISSFDATKPATIKGRININNQYGKDVKFENVTFAVNSESTKTWVSGGSIIKQKPSIFMSESSNQNITFNKCTFELSTTAYAFTSGAGGKICFNECKFNGNFNYAMYVRANIEVTGCTYTTTVTNVLVGACVNALENGKVVFTNNTLVSAGGNIGLSGAIVFASTNNDPVLGWVGPVEFTVKDNTGFAYTYERFNNFAVDPNRHTFTDGSEKFTF